MTREFNMEEGGSVQNVSPPLWLNKTILILRGVLVSFKSKGCEFSVLPDIPAPLNKAH
jgi:hypothetical protein